MQKASPGARVWREVRTRFNGGCSDDVGSAGVRSCVCMYTAFRERDQGIEHLYRQRRAGKIISKMLIFDYTHNPALSMGAAPLNFNRLRLFVAVVEYGSVTRAAEAISISQPAVTKAVHELERDLGLPLLDHVGRGVVPTEAGLLLANYARRIFALADEASRAMEDLRGLGRGRLAVGASTTIGIYLLPELLGSYRRRYPAIEVFLDIQNTQIVAERLREHLLDLALVEGPVEGDDLLIELFRLDELVLVTSPAHPLAIHGGATVSDLADAPFIMREPGSGTRDVVERSLAAAGIRPNVVMELGSTEAIKRAVAAELGVSIISRHTIGMEQALGRLAVVPVSGLHIERRLNVLQRRASHLTPAAAAFLALLAEVRSG